MVEIIEQNSCNAETLMFIKELIDMVVPMTIWLEGLLTELLRHRLVVDELKQGCQGLNKPDFCELVLQ